MGKYFSQPTASCFVGVNVVVAAILVVIAQGSGAFYLRLLWEGFAASYLILLTAWFCLGTSALTQRLLRALVGIVLVILASKYVLASGFESWFETATWYVPVSCTVRCITIVWERDRPATVKESIENLFDSLDDAGDGHRGSAVSHRQFAG